MFSLADRSWSEPIARICGGKHPAGFQQRYPILSNLMNTRRW
jgi:hypothetical protein